MFPQRSAHCGQWPGLAHCLLFTFLLGLSHSHPFLYHPWLLSHDQGRAEQRPRTPPSPALSRGSLLSPSALCFFCFLGEKLAPAGEQTDLRSLCPGHTFLADLDPSVSVLRVANDFSHREAPGGALKEMCPEGLWEFHQWRKTHGSP